MRVAGGADAIGQREREFDSGILGDEQRVIGQHLRGLAIEERGVKRDACGEVGRCEAEMNFHASTFCAKTARVADSTRSWAPGAKR